jgi:hypothetical protein
MDQRTLMWEIEGLKNVKYAIQMAKRYILHKMDEYL